MANYIPQTIPKLIESIESCKLVLPAIQRNFVWSEQRVCDLFDSIMRDYPIGTFLFWDVSSKEVQEYAFNRFLSYYQENRYDSYQVRERISPDIKNEYLAVLDGQQRITSIYLGIQGYYRMHIKGKKWNKPDSFENKYLCFDLLHTPTDDEDKYHFSFQNLENIEKRITNDETNFDEYWVKVCDIFSKDLNLLSYVLNLQLKGLSFEETSRASKLLQILITAIREKEIVHYYLATDKDLSKVVDIFVRVNSGGVKLAASDLMLSVAAGAVSNEDIQVKIQDAIERINNATTLPDELAFKADKELILTAGLLFIGAEKLSLMNKNNYSKSTMERILEKWDAIVESIYSTCIYIKELGFIGSKLTSKNLVLPIAYYFYTNHLDENHYRKSTTRAKKDKVFIRQWLLRAMINSIFRDGTGSTLLQIRKSIDESHKDYFPLDVLMEATGAKSLIIDDYEALMDYSSKDGRTQPLLIELAKADNREYHCDHIWPKSKMSTISKIKQASVKCSEKLSEDDLMFYKENYDRLPNLQILDKTPNQEKSNKYYDIWLEENYPDRTNRYYDDNLIPKGISYAYTNFRQFFNMRQELLISKIKEALPADFNAIMERNNL